MSSTIKNQQASFLGRNEAFWSNPEDSIGTLYRQMGNTIFWEAVGPALEVFNKIADEIKSHLEKSSGPVSHTVTWTMYMIGQTLNLARPTIMFCCQVPGPRKSIRKMIDKSGILDKYPGIVTGDSTRPPDFDKLVQLAGPENIGPPYLSLTEMEKYVCYVPSMDVCGVPMYVGDDDNPFKPLRKATIGGVLRAGLKYYCLTVGHVFMDDFQFPDLDSEIEPEFEFDVNGLSGNEIPDLRDFDIFSVLASGNGSRPGLDYALIETDDPKFDSFNRLNSMGSFRQYLLYPERIVSTRPRHNTKVLAATAFSGVLEGTISGTPTFMRIPSSSTFQEVWTVRLLCPVKHGDCGSWVVNLDSGDLYGHIIAGSPTSGTVYIVPAYEIIADLGARSGLPLCLSIRNYMNDHSSGSNLSAGEFQDMDRIRDTSTSNLNYVSNKSPLSLGLKGYGYESGTGSVSNSRSSRSFGGYNNASSTATTISLDGDPLWYQTETSKLTPAAVVPSQESGLNTFLFNIEQDGDPRIRWVTYYDFIVTKTEAYYQLQEGFLPSEKFPSRISSEKIMRNGQNLSICRVIGCTAKPFTRHYDLERHFKTSHGAKEQFHCDYNRCVHTEPFRKDHCREHYREYHAEDLLRRGLSKQDETIDDLLAARIGNIDLNWWRCSKCLQRVKVDIHGYTCHQCNLACEPARVAYRKEACPAIYKRQSKDLDFLSTFSLPDDQSLGLDMSTGI